MRRNIDDVCTMVKRRAAQPCCRLQPLYIGDHHVKAFDQIAPVLPMFFLKVDEEGCDAAWPKRKRALHWAPPREPAGAPAWKEMRFMQDSFRRTMSESMGLCC